MEYDVDSTHGYSGIHRYFEGMMKFLPSDKVKIKRGLADADPFCSPPIPTIS